MTTKGKVFMCLTFLFLGIGIGLVGGYKFANSQSNDGNQINVNLDGKIKKDGTVNVNVEGNDQNKDDSKKKNWFHLW